MQGTDYVLQFGTTNFGTAQVVLNSLGSFGFSSFSWIVAAMAPRKRARVSAASTPLGESQPRTPIEAGAPAFGFEESSNDPWTDDQETSLFKSMIRWKPTGTCLSQRQSGRLMLTSHCP